MVDGFRLPDRPAVLAFESGPYKGLELRVRLNIPLSLYFDLFQLVESKKADEIEEAARQFGEDVLMDWNFLDHNGEPIPANGEGMLRLDARSIGVVIGKFLGAVGQVSGPKGKRSGDGATSRARRASRSRPN